MMNWAQVEKCECEIVCLSVLALGYHLHHGKHDIALVSIVPSQQDRNLHVYHCASLCCLSQSKGIRLMDKGLS